MEELLKMQEEALRERDEAIMGESNGASEAERRAVAAGGRAEQLAVELGEAHREREEARMRIRQLESAVADRCVVLQPTLGAATDIRCCKLTHQGS